MRSPKLRGSTNAMIGPWPVGQIPDEVVLRIGKHIVHRIATGEKDISGDDYGNILANGVDGEHGAKPLGVVDVVRNGCGWSAKTVKHGTPHAVRKVRLISGRNSPDYSLGISDPRKNIAYTGKAVLAVWNQRVRESHGQFDDLRLMVLVRNMEAQEFLLFEEEITRFSDGNYEWRENRRGNFEGIEKATDSHCFTWQPHGAQFTIIRLVPGSARMFKINRVVIEIEPEHVWDAIGYSDEWIDIIG